MSSFRRWFVTLLLSAAIVAQLSFLTNDGSPAPDHQSHLPNHTAFPSSSPTLAPATQGPYLNVPADDDDSWTVGTNPTHCRVQPNRTLIDPYKGCPLPGLNNLLFTQVNRWFCAYRDNAVYHLRDRTCNKGTDEPYRFSTILQINYSKLSEITSSKSVATRAAICWSDIKRQDEPRNCAWKDIPSFYGTPLWWEARRMIDFHPVYYAVARAFVARYLGGEPFLAAHVRRGDYASHCVVIKRRGIPPWETFRHVPKLYPFEDGCYPPHALVLQTFDKIRAEEPSLRRIFVATNAPEEFVNVSAVVTMPSSKAVGRRPNDIFPVWFRQLDFMIVELLVLSLGDHFLFNRYSSFSGTAYESAYIHNRIQPGNAKCW